MSSRNTKGCRRLRHVALKGLAQKFTHSKLYHRDSSSKSVRGIWGETKLTNFSVRAPEAVVGTFLSEGRSADRCHCSFPELSSHPAGPAQEGTKSVLSINLVNIVDPLGDSFRPGCTQLTHPLKLPPAAPAQEWPTLVHAAASLKRLQTPHVVAALGSCSDSSKVHKPHTSSGWS